MTLDLRSRAFVIGSSIISTIITFLYLGGAQIKKRLRSFPYEYAMIAIAISFGLFNVLNVELQRLYPRRKRVIPFLVGGAMGLLFSLVGRFKYDLPRKLFGLSKRREWIVHPAGVVLYGAIFGLIVETVNKSV